MATKKTTKKTTAKKKPAAKKAPAKKKPAKKAEFDLASFQAGLSEAVPEAEVLHFSDENVVGHVSGYLDTGSIAINKAIGAKVGAMGVPRGRITEILGEESTGKTTFCAHVMADCQKQGGVAFVVDTEEKMDEKYTRALGVDVDKLVIIQPKAKTFEKVIDAIRYTLEHWLEKGLQQVPSVIVWDSLGATPTESEMDKQMGESGTVGGLSKGLSRAMRTLTGSIAQANTALIVTNHQYTDIPTNPYAARFGAKKKSYGGKAIRYHACLRLELKRIGTVDLPDGRKVGNKIVCRPIKNQLAPPDQEQTLAVTWGVGFDNTVMLFEALKDAKKITFGGSWYTLKTPTREAKFQQRFIGLGQRFFEDPTLRAEAIDMYMELP